VLEERVCCTPQPDDRVRPVAIALIVLYAAVQAGLLVWGHRHRDGAAQVGEDSAADRCGVDALSTIRRRCMRRRGGGVVLATARAAAADRSAGVFGGGALEGRTILYGLMLASIDFILERAFFRRLRVRTRGKASAACRHPNTRAAPRLPRRC
jgi:hypothetical protein